MSPNPALLTDAAAAEEQARARGGRDGAAPDGPPDGSRMSQDAQDLLTLQTDVTATMETLYERPEEAHRRLMELDEAGLERFKEDPSEIGPLRQGVEPTEETVGGLVAAHGSYDMAPESAKDEVRRYNDDLEAHRQAQVAARSPEARGIAEKMNETLAGAPTATYHLSI